MPIKKYLYCLTIFAFVAFQSIIYSQQKPEVKYYTSDSLKTLNLPFSDVVRVGNLLFVSGQVGIIPGKLALVPGGMAAEAKQTLENIRKLLEDNGSSLENVVKVTVMLADIKEWGAFNEVYKKYFTTNLPARSAFGTNGLALNARLEIEWVAVVK